MKIAFIHQNMPGQFAHLAAALACDPANEVVFITRRRDRQIPSVRRVCYGVRRPADAPIHAHLRATESALHHGQAVAHTLLALKRDGFVPDIVVGHSGWGETLFVKDILPGCRYVNYCEFYFQAEGQDFGFDPLYPAGPEARLALRMRCAPLLLALEACDCGLSPTNWQRSTHPEPLRSKIQVIHDGIDTALFRPDTGARVMLPGGPMLTRSDPVVTYVARSLEPYRGFPSFMRAIPHILDEHPGAVVLIVGDDSKSYGAAPADGGNWREAMLREVPVDPSRVHFLGRLPYDRYRAVLQLSRVHVYLTYPFVLSWSVLEAMATGCVVVGSDTSPVREVISHGENGLLADFFDPRSIADRVGQVLAEPAAFAQLRSAARQSVIDSYDLPICLDRQIRLLGQLQDA
ncbi:glycosyltransferase family 4 protein [Azospirillum sp. B506]|uniref:glycosyltransferase family 4 protein n=1 Tax=Azospirillum sp. B506 TaxID=137721 RepID=UPI0005B2D28E|nr:glycosyltransferase family 4 protein [Azospirillum sp. B506]